MSSIDVIASALEPVTPALGRMSSPDGAVTLMLSDIADAPAAAEELGPDRWEQLIRDHHLLVEQLVSRHDGQVMKWQGDGFLASFASAHAGLHGAVDLQRTFTAGPSSLAIRVGLHSGFVMGNPEQLMGRNVVLASRIAAQARGGEILVSSTAKDYTETDPSFRFEERGEYHFKGLLGEHVVFAVLWRD
ncbi:MAG TPA: adenylate/guanylate cyclase domain-containing protein [Solirubrobacteraceae bacterium]|nr:adenylate/guanylate cyclase domain-containing protein [Solirubrobacteraceae bacterium]